MHPLSHLAINAEGFVFNPSTGDSFHVSLTGLDILHCLRDGKSDEEILQRLTSTHEVGADDARRDLADFRASLKALGLN
jgi:hypothetical protein